MLPRLLALFLPLFLAPSPGGGAAGPTGAELRRLEQAGRSGRADPLIRDRRTRRGQAIRAEVVKWREQFKSQKA